MDTTYSHQTFCTTFPILVYIIREFADALTRAHTTKERLRFLGECWEEQIIPKCMIAKSLLEIEHQPFGDMQRSILEKLIHAMKIENRRAIEDVTRKRGYFEASIPTDWKDPLRRFCYKEMNEKLYRKLKQKHDKKLNALIERRLWNANVNPKCVVNLSNKILDKTVKCALGYGLNFSMSSRVVNSVEISNGVCNLEKVSDISVKKVNMIKGIIFSNMKEPVVPYCQKRFKKAITELKQDINIKLTKADKSGALIILDKDDYIEKMENLLSDENTYIELRKNSIEFVNSNYNKKVRDTKRE
ncbi:uncharacterized protein [Palaemon carinicauda]|uniref:uncharacterized protein n=1 Tax=Palaemon carinicauda TaxID=392227 RepID=UPI0035B6487F